MRHGVRCLLLAGTLLSLAAQNAIGNQSTPSQALQLAERRLVELYEQHKEALVKVKVAIQSRDENGKDQVALTVLSGFFIDAKGTVLTNAVPMQEGPRMRIEKDGIQYLAVPIASDTRSNLGLIQVAKPPQRIEYIDLWSATPEPQIGSLAYSITSPLEFEPTPKIGLVTGAESSFSDIAFPFTYIRVSIDSGPAEGGSPVFNSQGQLIGVSVASLPDISSSYIVPIKPLQKIAATLGNTRGYVYTSVSASFAERGNPNSGEKSVFTTSVEPEGAAARSGLAKGDRIRSFDGIPIDSMNALRDALFFSEVGSYAKVEIERNDAPLEIQLLMESGNAN